MRKVLFCLAIAVSLSLTACRAATKDHLYTASTIEAKPSSMFLGEFLEEIRKLNASYESNYLDVLIEYQKINNDTFAVVFIPQLGIEEPVVTCDSNYDYLRYNIYGDYDIRGTVFLDSTATSSSPIRLIHGHNMNDGKIFSPLVDLLDYDADDLIELSIYLCEDFGVSEYRIFSVFTASSDDLKIDVSPFSTESDVESAIAYLSGRSAVELDECVGNDIILLNTCWYGTSGDLRDHHCIIAAYRV